MGKLLVDKLRAICAEKEEKGQLWYAFYFAVMIALQFNPMADERNRVVHFKRLIGAGIIQNVDVARRTSNFSCWFILFIISFVIIFSLKFQLIIRPEIVLKMILKSKIQKTLKLNMF